MASFDFPCHVHKIRSILRLVQLLNYVKNKLNVVEIIKNLKQMYTFDNIKDIE